jgi:hypothetical protein
VTGRTLVLVLADTRGIGVALSLNPEVGASDSLPEAKPSFAGGASELALRALCKFGGPTAKEGLA